MIRNIEDEKKYLSRRRDDGLSGYLSDEALSELIDSVEEKEILRAPAHLKENVIAQIRHDRYNAKKRQVFVYRVKVLAAMAAALAVLILMPVDGTEDAGGMFAGPQAYESLEQMALEHQRDIDADWERYLKERESDGVRGFFREINEKITEFGIEIKIWR